MDRLVYKLIKQQGKWRDYVCKTIEDLCKIYLGEVNRNPSW
jgi:hypothetical protein